MRSRCLLACLTASLAAFAAGGPCDFTVVNAEEAAALMDSGCTDVSVVWEGHVAITETIVVSPGATMIVTGGDGAVVDGVGAVRLFSVSGGGALYLSSLTLTGGVARDIAVPESGVSQYTSDGNATKGGGVYVYGGTATLESCTITGNTAAEYGGGVYVYDGTATLESCTITGNNATKGGGGVYVVSNGTATLESCTITGNTAADTGGGVHVGYFSTATLESCYITGNTADYGGGVALDSGTATLESCYITGNTAALYGGGVAKYSGNATLESCTITGNTAAEYGGGVYVYDGTATLESCNITGNTAAEGGGVLLQFGTATLESCYINGNTADYGGGVAKHHGNATLESCTITGNTAAEYGGGVYVDGGTATLESCNITGNTADYGGGVAKHYGNATLESCNITGNSAEYGGGVYVGYGTATLESCNITGNTAEYGGGVYLSSNCNAFMVSCVISRNTASMGRGGGIYTLVDITLTGSTFDNNRAETDGGAVGVGDHDPSVPDAFLSVYTCIFLRNSANGFGGAIYSKAHVLGPGSSFTHNTAGGAGGAIFVASAGDSDRTDNFTFTNNAASCCYALPAADGRYSCADVGGPTDSSQPCCYADTVADNYDNVCATCPFGFDCTKIGPYPALDRGKWRGDVGDQDVTTAEGFVKIFTAKHCLFTDACIGGSGSPDTKPSEYCTDGYEGPLCAVCVSGYAPGTANQCHECTTASRGVLIFAVVLLASVAVAIVWFVVADLWDLGDGQDATDAAQGSAQALASKSLHVLQRVPWTKLRIPVVALQIVTQYIKITGVALPAFYNKFLSALSVVTVDLGGLLSASCILPSPLSFYTRLLVVTVLPLATAATIVGSWVWMHRCITRPRPSVGPRAEEPTRSMSELVQRVREKHATLLLVFTFLVYSTVSSVIFQTFACDSDAEAGESWLRADYRVTCHETRTRKAYLAYASIMVILYPVGIPVAYAWLLWRHRTNATARSTSFLRQPYTEHCSLWEVAECIRRLCLTGFIVFIYAGTSGQAAVACVFAVVSLLSIAFFQPHVDKNDFYVYLLGCAIIFFTTFVALLTEVDPGYNDSQTQTVLSVLSIVVTVLMLLAAIAQCTLVLQQARKTSVRQSSWYGLRRSASVQNVVVLSERPSVYSDAHRAAT